MEISYPRYLVVLYARCIPTPVPPQYVAHLLFVARSGTRSLVEERVLRRGVIVLPLYEVIRDVEAPVVVRTVLEVDQHELALSRILAQQYVTLLHVVVTEHHWVLLLHYQRSVDQCKRNR